jgi:glycerol kinase
LTRSDLEPKALSKGNVVVVILVLNIGLKNARCIAFSADGELLHQIARPVQTYVSNERVEQDPAEWRNLTDEVIAEVVTETGSDWFAPAVGTVHGEYRSEPQID